MKRTIRDFFSKPDYTRFMTERRKEILQTAITKVFPNCTIKALPIFYITHPDDEVLTLDIQIINKISGGKSFKSTARFEIDFEAPYNKAMKEIEVAVIEFIKDNSTYDEYMDNYHYHYDNI